MRSSEWQIRDDQVTIDPNVPPLGQGGFGIVYKGKYRFDEVAVKQLLISDFSVEAEQELQREAAILGQLRSPHIVHFYGVCIDTQPYRLVMEYAPYGSLYKVLHDRSKPLSWEERYRISRNIATGLHYLHEEKIIHRDFKSLNVLMDKDGNPKIADFGLAQMKRETNSQTQQTNQTTGSVLWMAPELFRRGAVHTTASDIFALGVVLWEIATRKTPWQDEENANQFTIPLWVQSGERNRIPDDCPAGFKQLIEACWHQEPNQRPTTAKVIERLQQLYKATQTNDTQSTTSQDKSPTTIVSGPQYVSHDGPDYAGTQSVNFTATSVADTPLGGPCYVSNLQDTQPQYVSNMLSDLRINPATTQISASNEQPTIELLLKYVAEGEQEKAEALLKSHPELALQKGTVTDLSERTFENITAFQYAVWALDWHMWTMIHRFLTDDQTKQQLDEFFNTKIFFTTPTGELSSHSGGNLIIQLILTLQQHMEKRDNKALTPEILQNNWCIAVGNIQRQQPVHVVNQYCRTDKAFYPYHDFDDLHLPRGRQTQNGDWFNGEYNGGKLGSTFAIGQCSHKMFMKNSVPLRATFRTEAEKATNGDIKALVHLLETTIKHFKHLLQECAISSELLTNFELQLTTIKTHQQLRIEQDTVRQKQKTRTALQITQTSTKVATNNRLQNLRLFSMAQEAKVNQREVNQLLKLVAEGEQDKAEVLILKNKNLLLAKGEVTDLSQRLFKNITAFQYAVWALDWHMWTMLLKYLPPSVATQQLTDYERGTFQGTLQNGSSLEKTGAECIQELCNALFNYCKNYDNWSDTQRKNYWCRTVSNVQFYVPAHVANEYCRTDRMFVPCPRFKENNLPRLRNTEEGDWYDMARFQKPETWGFTRAKGSMVTGKTTVKVNTWLFIYFRADCDRLAVTELLSTRNNQLLQLRKSLLPKDLISATNTTTAHSEIRMRQNFQNTNAQLKNPTLERDHSSSSPTCKMS